MDPWLFEDVEKQVPELMKKIEQAQKRAKQLEKANVRVTLLVKGKRRSFKAPLEMFSEEGKEHLRGLLVPPPSPRRAKKK